VGGLSLSLKSVAVLVSYAALFIIIFKETSPY
jgi:hypothetical protein